MTPYTSLPARRQNSFWRKIGMLLLWWMLSFSFSTSLLAQDGDFYQYLSESNSVNEFLKPQLSGRIMPFAGNETINKKYQQLIRNWKSTNFYWNTIRLEM